MYYEINEKRWLKFKKDIRLEESIEKWNGYHKTTTLYFIAPLDLVSKHSDCDEFITIAIEFPTIYDSHFDPEKAHVSISPAKKCEDTKGFIDYYWCEYDMPYDWIDYLLDIYYEARYPREEQT